MPFEVDHNIRWINVPREVRSRRELVKAAGELTKLLVTSRRISTKVCGSIRGSSHRFPSDQRASITFTHATVDMHAKTSIARENALGAGGDVYELAEHVYSVALNCKDPAENQLNPFIQCCTQRCGTVSLVVQNVGRCRTSDTPHTSDSSFGNSSTRCLGRSGSFSFCGFCSLRNIGIFSGVYLEKRSSSVF